MSQSILRAGIVGVGLAAQAHARGYATHPAAQVSAVCDLDRARAEAFAAQHHIAQVYTDYATMLAEAPIEIVDIATPTHLHTSMTVQAAQAGKHIHCEKPFCRSGAEGMQAVVAAREAGVKLAVGETYVFLASHMQARALIDAGEIGRPLQMRQRHGAWFARPHRPHELGGYDRSWRLDPARSGGGAYPWIYDHAVHFFATAEYLMPGQTVDRIYAVKAGARQAATGQGAAHDPYRESEVDIPLITWTYDDPACQGVWMRAERLNGKFDYMHGFSTAIMGERGMIEVLGEGGHNLLWNGAQQHLILHREGKDSLCFRFEEGGDQVWDSEISYYGQGHCNQVHHLINSILHDTAPRYGGEAGVHAVRCTLAAIHSAQTGHPVRVAEIGDEFRAYG